MTTDDGDDPPISDEEMEAALAEARARHRREKPELLAPERFVRSIDLGDGIRGDVGIGAEGDGGGDAGD